MNTERSQQSRKLHEISMIGFTPHNRALKIESTRWCDGKISIRPRFSLILTVFEGRKKSERLKLSYSNSCWEPDKLIMAAFLCGCHLALRLSLSVFCGHIKPWFVVFKIWFSLSTFISKLINRKLLLTVGHSGIVYAQSWTQKTWCFDGFLNLSRGLRDCVLPSKAPFWCLN